MFCTTPSVIHSSSINQSGAGAARHTNASLLDLVRLTPLMELTSGRANVSVGLIDGPVASDHPDLATSNIREIPGSLTGTCARADSLACMHGTFVAGILSANRGSAAPAICPDCTLLLRPIFAESSSNDGRMPSATPEELATAIVDCIENGARIINLSAALAQPSAKGERKLEEALDYSARRGVFIVAASGNQGTVGSSAITRHPWVIPVIACDGKGRPISYSNLGNSIGRRGLSAPGAGVQSLATNGQVPTFSGTSAAAPFVTGAIALLQSLFVNATVSDIRIAITSWVGRRRSVVPILLDAWMSYQILAKSQKR